MVRWNTGSASQARLLRGRLLFSWLCLADGLANGRRGCAWASAASNPRPSLGCRLTNQRRRFPVSPPPRPQPANRCEGLSPLYFPEGLAARSDLSAPQRLSSSPSGSCESPSGAARAFPRVQPEPFIQPFPAEPGVRRSLPSGPASPSRLAPPRPARTQSAPPSPGRDGAHHPDSGPAGRWPQAQFPPDFA